MDGSLRGKNCLGDINSGVTVSFGRQNFRAKNVVEEMGLYRNLVSAYVCKSPSYYLQPVFEPKLHF